MSRIYNLPSGPIYYLQPCPICGRRLQIRAEYIGRIVECVHCRASLLAQDPEMVQANIERAETMSTVPLNNNGLAVCVTAQNTAF